MRTIKNIIWDWNGTLLNDIDISIEAMNVLLQKRNMLQLTQHRYREVFTFPVKKYYKNIGFDFGKEAFEIPAMEFIHNYHKLFSKAKLFNNVEGVLKAFKAKGYNQYILSAMEHESLLQCIDSFSIAEYFEGVYGISDHYAKSKVDNGIKLFEENDLTPETVIMIGDTLHDKEVADKLKCKCILLEHGHQSGARLNINGNTVFSSFEQLVNNITIL